MLIPPTKVVILCSNRQDIFPTRCELPVDLVWMEELIPFLSTIADIYIDLDFDGSSERKDQLLALQKTVLVNGVNWTCSELPPGFIRLNAWPGFTHPELVELAFEGETLPERVEFFFQACGKTWLKAPDVRGMIRPRILAMILNEAWLALEEGVSSREEIDTAMKLGTNYPMGPFEWSGLIGERNLLQLLYNLSAENPAYKPSRLLEQSCLTQ